LACSIDQTAIAEDLGAGRRFVGIPGPGLQKLVFGHRLAEGLAKGRQGLPVLDQLFLGDGALLDQPLAAADGVELAGDLGLGTPHAGLAGRNLLGPRQLFEPS
jgi:hypothetical protein